MGSVSRDLVKEGPVIAFAYMSGALLFPNGRPEGPQLLNGNIASALGLRYDGRIAVPRTQTLPLRGETSYVVAI